MKKYQLLLKISAVFSYLFFVFGLSQLTLIVQNYWQFSSQIGNFVWIQNIFSLLFSGVMIWILVKTGHGYLFRIPRKKWLWYSILTVLVVVLQISFNVQLKRPVSSVSPSLPSCANGEAAVSVTSPPVVLVMVRSCIWHYTKCIPSLNLSIRVHSTIKHS